ncbi:hypothetical protein G6R40_05265 [Chryseobacterium sp. POL2]|uniref:hypothetical protein n=1 Tax=Chryseobacterium sp. POL2 TaxID=2713414 RepID=UPI0013E0F9CB|nr:hypothetical protein [Chryseobacterium sp. POL2]QIG89116.1 hypothetical protein G6R40_05265 [Chryseobacterium sp. POL2]
MKKIILLCTLIFAFASFSAQNYNQLNDIISKIEKRAKQNRNATDFQIQNKKFVLIQTFEDHDERHVVEFNGDNTVTLIELFDDKATKQTSSNIFTGDYVRKNNVISIRADKLEGKKIGMPLTYTLYLMNAKNIWYLKDLSNDTRWIENKNLGKKK